MHFPTDRTAHTTQVGTDNSPNCKCNHMIDQVIQTLHVGALPPELRPVLWHSISDLTIITDVLWIIVISKDFVPRSTIISRHLCLMECAEKNYAIIPRGCLFVGFFLRSIYDHLRVTYIERVFLVHDFLHPSCDELIKVA